MILGGHNTESATTRMMSLLVDDRLALDAGGLTGSLPFHAQTGLRAVLLTHAHYDHLRDIPALAMNFFLREQRLRVYATGLVRDALTTHLLNGEIYPRFLETPAEKPVVDFSVIEPGQPFAVDDYRVLPVAVDHHIPTTGFQVTAPGGPGLFYTGDTGSDLAEAWGQVSPRLLIIETTMPDSYEDQARRTGHLTPRLLGRALRDFQNIRGYLPQVVTVHMNPHLEGEIEAGLKTVAGELNIAISPAHEGMRIHL